MNFSYLLECVEHNTTRGDLLDLRLTLGVGHAVVAGRFLLEKMNFRNKNSNSRTSII
jgi:hypothetical protein